ncbi:MAG: hypothetical protein ACN4E2_03780 [Nitrospinota bacterium]
MLIEEQSTNPIGSLLILAVLMFIVYRVLTSINKEHQSSHQPLSSGESISTIFKVKEGPTVELPVVKPKEIMLTKVANVDHFKDVKLAENLETALLSSNLKFNRINDFLINLMEGYVIRSYSSSESFLVTILYKDPKGFAWVNFLTEYADGRIITTSSASKDRLMLDRPRGMPIYSYPDLEIKQVLRRHKLETRLAKLKDPINSESEFKEFFIRNYSKLQNRITDKFRIGDEPLNIDIVEDIDLNIGYQAEQPKDEPANILNPSPTDLNRWLTTIIKRLNVPKSEQNKFKKSLVWVQDEAPKEVIAGIIRDYTDASLTEVEQDRWVISLASGDEDIVDSGGLKGSRLFDKLNSALPAKEKFFKITTDIEGVAFYSKMNLKF